MSLPSTAEVEHADWPTLQRMCADLGLNPKGRSGLVRMRVLDHVRRRSRPEPWRPTGAHLAPLLTRLGHPDVAARLWESAIRLEAPAPWVGYGSARLAAGELDEAGKAFDRAAQMGDDVALLHKAELLAARADLSGAVQACDAYLERRPDDLRGLALKATFLARGGSIDEAVATAQRAADVHTGVPEAVRGLGILLLKAGRPADAAQVLGTAIQKARADVEAMVARGTALLLAGRTREAIAAYREALEREPQRPEALNGLGVAHLASGSARSALADLERAAKLLESPQLLVNLGRARRAADQRTTSLQAEERTLPIARGRKESAARRDRRAPPKPQKKSAKKAPQRRKDPSVRTKRAAAHRKRGPSRKPRRR